MAHSTQKALAVVQAQQAPKPKTSGIYPDLNIEQQPLEIDVGTGGTTVPP